MSDSLAAIRDWKKVPDVPALVFHKTPVRCSEPDCTGKYDFTVKGTGGMCLACYYQARRKRSCDSASS